MLLMHSPSNACRESSTPVNSCSERRARLTRMSAVDVDDSDSQTSTSCPASSSSTSTSPPTVHHEVAQREYTTIPPLLSAALSGTASQFQMPSRPVTAMCRVRPLTNVDWRGSGQRHAGSSTVSPEAAVLSASMRRDRSGAGGPVRSDKSAITVTSRSSRRCVGPSSTTVPCSYDEDCVIAVDDDVMTAAAAPSKTTVYDNVQQLHL